MKTHTNPFALILVALMTLSAGPALAGSDQNGKLDYQAVEEEMSQTLRTLKQYTVQQKQEATQAAAGAVKKVEQDIKRLEHQLDQQAGEMSAQARQQKRETLTTLRQQQRSLEQAYETMKEESGDAWDKGREKFQNAYQQARDQWQELAS